MEQQELRISADELKRRMSAGEEFTMVDARNPQAWAEAKDKARGAIRVDFPRNKPTVVYCT